MDRVIVPNKTLGYTSLYIDFLAGKPPAGNFYSGDSVDQIAHRFDTITFPRERLVEILRRQNTVYGSSPKAVAHLEQLADPKAVCIFAGQQAGLFGGPLLSLLKGLAIAKAAVALREQLKRPVVPIFWIAGDDHDFEEVNHTWLSDQNGELCRIEYNLRPSQELPVGHIKFTDAAVLRAARDKMKDCLGNTDFAGGLYDLLDKAYTPDDTFVTAFGKLMASLTADYGLVFFAPTDPDIKRLASPFFKSVLEKENPIHRLLSERNSAIEQAGYHLQVHKNEDAVHLFVNLDGRKPIHREGKEFIAGDKQFSRAELDRLIDSEPERFSPDVMTRTAFQSYLFPVVAQMGGPSEIAYYAQTNVLFDLIDRPTPHHLARPSLVLVEKRYEKLMAEYNIRFEEIAGDIEQLVNRVLALSFPDDLEKQYTQLRADLKLRIERFGEESLAFDPALRDFGRQTFSKIDFALRTFEEKLFASHKKKSKDIRERLYRLRTALYPNNALQDRTYSPCYFVAKHGPKAVSLIYDHLDPFQPAPKLVPLSEMDA